jgi:OPA family sugar phosphate sensor protein UhpC-like MFS transporter
MNYLFNLLQPAPYLPEIQDSKEVDAKYRYWRIRIMYSTFLGYAMYYFTRKSFIFAMPALITDLGLSIEELGILGSVLSITYGISKFLSGVLSDKSNPRYFMAIGLFMTGVCNILFGMSSSLPFFIVFWGLNGYFQGFGWPPSARFLTQWYSQSERGSWWSTWSVSHNVGSFIIPWIVLFCFYMEWGWRFAMYVPGMICILGSLFLINRLRDTPQSLGLPPVEKYRNDYPEGKKDLVEDKKLTTKEILFEHVLNNKYIWALGLAYFFVYIVRMGVSDWSLLYLTKAKDSSAFYASASVVLFDVGGFLGNLSAGWASDRLFKAKRGPVNAIFAIGIILSAILFWNIPPGYPLLDAFSIFILGYTIFGPQMMIGIAAAEVSHKNAAATSTGFVGFTAYIGAAVAGYPLGKITQEYGWNGFFIFLIACSMIAFVCLIPLWLKDSRLQTAKEPEPQSI